MFWLCQLPCVNNEIIPFFLLFYFAPFSFAFVFVLSLMLSIALFSVSYCKEGHIKKSLFKFLIWHWVEICSFITGIYIYFFGWDTSIVMLTYLLHKYLLLLVHCVHPDGDDLFFFHILFTNKITGINLWAGLSVSRMMTWRLLKECIAHALYYRYSY